jgi:uncharacterized membrane protein YesL
MEMRGMMGGFYKLSEWIMRLSVINVLWLLVSIPFWFVMLNVFSADNTDQLKSTIIFLSILAPFTLFPATSAMFSVARKWVTGEVDVPLFKTFFRNYKQNYLQAMIGGIVYALLLGILIVDFQVYANKIAGFSFVAYLFVFLFFLVLVSLLYFFSLLSHFQMKTTQLLKNAFVLTIGRPIRSLFMAVGTAVILFAASRFPFLIPFFFGSVIAVYTYYHFNLIIQKMMMQQEKSEAGDEETIDEGKESQA